MAYELLLLGQLEWNISLLICLLCIAIVYAYLHKQFTDKKIHHKQPLLFFLAICLLYLLTGSPLSEISHLSFSLHMIQMSILYFILPPLFLTGIPDQLFHRISKIPTIQAMSRLIPPPKFALFLFALFFLLYHFPFVLKVISQNSLMQNGYMLTLFILAFIMWWPIVSPDPKQRYFTKQKKHYAFLSAVILMPACVFFIVNALVIGTNNPFLTQMTAQLCLPAQPESLGLLPSPVITKFDQITAGVLMLGVHKLGIMLSFRLGG